LTTYAWGFSCLDTKGGMELREYIQSDYWDGKYTCVVQKLPFLERILYYILRYRMTCILSFISRAKSYVSGGR
jgi:hypothetical protein